VKSLYVGIYMKPFAVREQRTLVLLWNWAL